MAILCENNQSMENDLEDGEIEDDEEEEQLNLESNNDSNKEKSNSVNPSSIVNVLKDSTVNLNADTDEHVQTFVHKDKSSHRRSERHHTKHESKSSRKRQLEIEDDWAGNVEKAIASALKIDKEQKSGDTEEEETEKRKTKKRKKKDRDRDKKKKRRKSDEEVRELPQEGRISPPDEEIDEDEMLCIRGGSPKPQVLSQQQFGGDESPFGQPFNDPYDSYDSEYDSEPYAHRNKRNYERDREKKRDRSSRTREGSKRERKNFKEKNRDRRQEKNRPVMQDSNNICLFYMQGKCHKGDECTYSHAAMPPMKLELCKFYLMDCCAKRDKCLYMHSEFPCKYYHTGLRCVAGERGQCKFAHGSPLSENLKQVLLKHLETAPKEILGDFPRLSREGAQHLVNATQKKLESQLEPNKAPSHPTNNSSSKAAIPSLFDITVCMPAQLIAQTEDLVPDIKTSVNTPQTTDNNFTPTPNVVPKTESKSPRSRPSRWNSEKEQININLLPNAALINMNSAFVSNKVNSANIFDNLNIQDQQKIQNYQSNFGFQGFYSEKDQDMRVMSNGDVDMRSLNVPAQQTAQKKHDGDSGLQSSSNNKTDKTAASESAEKRDKSEEQKALTDLDMRDLDMRFSMHDGDNLVIDNSQEENALEIDETNEDMPLKIDVNDEDERNSGDEKDCDLPSNLPKKQRELFLRIKAQQKENLPKDEDSRSDDEVVKDEDWYSSDEEETPLSKVLKNLKSEDKDERCKDKDERQKSSYQPEEIKPSVIEPLTLQPGKMINTSELSKIDISAEVTKLLSLVKNQPSSAHSPTHSTNFPASDPRMQSRDPRQSSHTSNKENKSSGGNSTTGDPRMKRKSSTEKEAKVQKISIYELGAINISDSHKDVDLRNLNSLSSKDSDLRDGSYGDTDLRNGRSDVDLRQLALPFKPMQNYVPATEIDASINSHSPITYKVYVCDIPRPDYSGLKLSATDAQATADPRIRKILRIGSQPDPVDTGSSDSNTPSSPKQSSNSSSSATKTSSSSASARVDPRTQRKMQLPKSEPPSSASSTLEQIAMNNGASLNYNQQIQLLQNSAFYQTLTSNQKLILNQAIANQKAEQNGIQNDPILAAILSNLGLTNQLTTNVMMNPAMSIMSLLNLGSTNFNAMSLGNMNPSLNNMMPGNIGPLVNSGPNNVGPPSIGPPSLLGPGPGTPLLGNMNNMNSIGSSNMMGPPNDFSNIGYGPVNSGPNNPGLLGHSPYQNMGITPPGNFGPPQSGDNFQFGDGNGGPPFFGNVGGEDMENGNNGFGYGGGGPPNQNRDRGFRDRPNRRGGRGSWNPSNCGSNRHNSRNNFQSRRNKSNRSHTPP